MTGGSELRGSPTPNELRAFLAVAETLHFGRTAQQLGLAQSSLSETIRRLEARLDTILLERTSRKVALTEAGRQVVPVARDIVRALAAIRESSPRPGAPNSAFRIGIEVPGLLDLTGPVIDRFRSLYPDLPLVFKEFSCAHGFVDLGLDVALVRTPLDDERLVAHPVATEPRAYIMPASHPLASAPALSLADLEDEPFVALDPRAPNARAYWLAVADRDGATPRIGAHAFTAKEIADAVTYADCVAVGLMSSRGATTAFATVPATDLAVNTVSVAMRAGDDRHTVLDFLGAVRDVLAQSPADASVLTPVGAPARRRDAATLLPV